MGVDATNNCIVNPYVPYAYADMLEDCLKLAIAYRDIISVRTIGFSVEKRAIPLITFGCGQKKIFLCGAHHGREYITAAYLMKLTEEYTVYAVNRAKFGPFDVARIFGAVTFHIVPMVNPDGVEIAQKGIPDSNPIKASIGVNQNFREWKANANGVDLNRQYPCLWDHLNTGVEAPAPAFYKGSAPATEPEVKAVMDLCLKNNYDLAAAFHTKGEEIYYADSLTNGSLPQARGIANTLAYFSGYKIVPVSKDPASFAGGFENWFRMAFLRPAFLIEMTPDDGSPLPHNDRLFDRLVWDKACYIGLALANAALNL